MSKEFIQFNLDALAHPAEQRRDHGRKGSLRSRVIALGWSQWTADCRTRALVRDLLVSDADIEPDDTAKTLNIRIHRMANPSHDKAVTALLSDLTLQGFRHPDSGAKMICTLV